MDSWEKDCADIFSDSSSHCEHLSTFIEQHLSSSVALSFLDRMSSIRKDVRGLAGPDISRNLRPSLCQKAAVEAACVSSHTHKAWIYVKCRGGFIWTKGKEAGQLCSFTLSSDSTGGLDTNYSAQTRESYYWWKCAHFYCLFSLFCIHFAHFPPNTSPVLCKTHI